MRAKKRGVPYDKTGGYINPFKLSNFSIKLAIQIITLYKT
jgi:hypothetical protein